MRVFSIFGMLLLMGSLSGPALSQHHPRGNWVEYSTGTGFFVGTSGTILTNHHVISECDAQNIQVRSDNFDWVRARKGRADAKYDLALLHADINAPKVATILSSEYQMNTGDSVVVIGYPGEHSQTGKYKFVKSRVTGLKGPSGEPHWVQFVDVVQQGNSGGPLLDQAGNVLGVVTGKAELYQVNTANQRQTFIGSSAIAVSLPIVKKFLTRSGVHYARRQSNLDRSDNFIEHKARDFIVNVRCVTGTRAG